MPTYEFLCEPCGIEAEKSLPISHGPQTCDVCGGPVKKLISRTAGFITRGFSVDHMESKARLVRRRSREHFVRKGRDEAIANGGTEWRAGNHIDDVRKQYPGVHIKTPVSHEN